MEQNIANALLSKYGDSIAEKSDIRHDDSGDEHDNHSDDDHINNCCDDDHHKHEPDVDSMSDEQYVEYVQSKNQASNRSGGNTGIKGVLGDYAEYREQQKQAYKDKMANTRAMIEKMSFTTRDQPTQTQVEDELDSDEEDLERIRKARLEQWKNKQKSSTADNSVPKNKVFGYLKQITAQEYVDEIDNEPPNVFVIIHLFQSYVPTCVLLNNYLGQMAVKYRHIKFIKILSTEAKSNYHDAALPSLLVYIGGKLLVSFIPITEELGNTFDKEDVELLLSSYDIIPNPNQAKRWETSLTTKRADLSDDDYDD